MRFAISYLPSTLLVLAACGGSEGEAGDLLAGRARASEAEVRRVDLAGRTLLLDGFAGTITVAGTNEPGTRAVLRFERVARGATEGSARRRLDGVRIEEAGDAEVVQYLLRASPDEGAEVNVRAQVPRAAALQIRLGTGTVYLSGAGGEVGVEVGGGPIRATGLAGRRVALRTGAGAVEAAAERVPDRADWRFETRAGGITVTLPTGAPARVEAEARTGVIRVDGLAFRDERLDRRAAGARFSGRLGEGTGRIVARADVGRIAFRPAE